MFLLFLLSISSIAASSQDIFSSFAVDNHMVYSPTPNQDNLDFGLISHIGICSDGIVMQASGQGSTTLIKINPQGTEVARAILTTRQANSIYWDSSNFVVPVLDGIQQYNNSDLSLNDSFGTNGTASFPSIRISSNDYTLDFSVVTKSANYYYAVGWYRTDVQRLDTVKLLVVRFELDGTPDTSFNSGSPYVLIATDNVTVFIPNEIIVLKNNIIIKTSDAFGPNDIVYGKQIISIPSNPLNGSSPTILEYGSTQVPVMTAASDNDSLFVFHNNTLFKYMADLSLDTSFNGSGSVTFTEPSMIFSVSFTPFTMTRVGTRIFVGGGYVSDSTQLPCILCYDISHLNTIVLDTSFFGTGYFIPNVSYYSNSQYGVGKIAFTSTTVPSLFFASTHYVTHVILPGDFTRKILVRKTLLERLAFEEAQGNRIPFLV